MITAKLVEFDRPTINGRVYPKEVLEKALQHWKDHFKTETIPIFRNPTATPSTEDIVGYAEKFRFEDGYLVADIGFLPERIQEVAEDGETINIRPNGIGAQDTETGIIHEGYRIFGLTVRRRNPVVGAVIKEKSEVPNEAK